MSPGPRPRAVLPILSMALMLTLPSALPAQTTQPDLPGLQWYRADLGQVEGGKLVEGGQGLFVHGTELAIDGACKSWARLFNSTTGKLNWTVKVDGCAADFLDHDLNGNGRMDLVVLTSSDPWSEMNLSIYLDGALAPTLTHDWQELVWLEDVADLDMDNMKDLIFAVARGRPADEDFNITLEARSGKDLALLWSFNLNDKVRLDNSALQGINVVDFYGDWFDDLMVWVQGHPPPPDHYTRGFMVQGLTGHTYWTTRIEDQLCGSVVVPRNETGSMEFVVLWESIPVAGGFPQMYVETLNPDGKQTSVLYLPGNLNAPGPIIEDYDGDGLPEIGYVAQGPRSGYDVTVREIHGGAVIMNASVESTEYFPSVWPAKDLDSDGIPEFLVIGSSIWIFRGRDSSLYRELKVPPISHSYVIEEGLIAYYSMSHFTNPDIVRVGLANLSTGETAWTLPYKERVNDVQLQDVDMDGRLEMFITTENITAKDKGNGKVLMYGLGEEAAVTMPPPTDGPSSFGHSTRIADELCLPLVAAAATACVSAIVIRYWRRRA